MTTSSRTPEKYELNDKEFKLLFDRYWTEVYRICHYYTRERESAEDLTQNVFVITWQKRKMLQQPEMLLHYLYRCAKLEALSYVKQQASREKKLQLLHAQDEATAAVNSTEADILYAEAEAKLKDAIEALPEKTKIIFEMSHLQGAEVKSIAQTLKIGSKAVEYYLYRAIKQIKSKFLFFL